MQVVDIRSIFFLFKAKLCKKSIDFHRTGSPTNGPTNGPMIYSYILCTMHEFCNSLASIYQLHFYICNKRLCKLTHSLQRGY